MKKTKGLALMLTVSIAAVLCFLAAALFFTSSSNQRWEDQQHRRAVAMTNAEAGVERALADLRRDYLANPGGNPWLDGAINGRPFTANGVPQDIYTDVALNGGVYTVRLTSVPGRPDYMWIWSQGNAGGMTQAVEVYATMLNMSMYTNAVFAGGGIAGNGAIRGNANIHGSVHILGNNLAATENAMAMTGTGMMFNNYLGLPQELRDMIPPVLDDSNIENLMAELRVRRGRVSLSGTSSLGQDPLATTPGFYGNIAGSFVTGGATGYTGTAGVSAVFSDNGYENGYDLGDAMQMPSLYDPFEGFPTYIDYLKANAYVITASEAAKAGLDNIRIGTTTFNLSGPHGTLRLDANGNLFIDGLVFIEGGNAAQPTLRIESQGNRDTIRYSGNGSIYAENNVVINANLMTTGANSFPVNIIGFMTPRDILFQEAQIAVMGLFYAEGAITVQKQTTLIGTIASNYFSLLQVPGIYRVPAAARAVPRFQIDSHLWVIKVVSWRKLP